jgi:IS1 family transposase
MANALGTDKQVAVISALAEGSGIRQIERITGVHRDTVMRLGVRVGKGCANLLDRKMRNLSCNHLQFDEVWGFIGKKERHCTVDDSPEVGDVWTFCAIDQDTKIVPSFRVGKRDAATANAFVADVASRLKNRVQISSDALRAYVDAIEMAFGANVDFAQIVLTYAFSKKRENFEAAVALHFAYYNFVKRHNTLRCTPAMAAGVERDFWSVRDLVQAAA